MNENTFADTNEVDEPNKFNTNEVDEPKDFADMSEVDIAYKLLTTERKLLPAEDYFPTEEVQSLPEDSRKKPVYFKTLIRTIIELKGKAGQNDSAAGKSVQNEAAAISEIYTMINMDSRFQHMGDGLWGLTDWNPPETKRASRARSATSKATS